MLPQPRRLPALPTTVADKARGRAMPHNQRVEQAMEAVTTRAGDDRQLADLLVNRGQLLGIHQLRGGDRQPTVIIHATLVGRQASRPFAASFSGALI